MSSLNNGWKGLAKQSGDLSNSLEARNNAIEQAEDTRRATLAKNAPKQWTDYLSSEPVIFSDQVLHFAHSNLCLSDFHGRVTLIPCSMTRKIHGDQPKNKISTPSKTQLNWSTKEVKNTGGHLVIVHQGKCLTPESISSAATKGASVAELHMKQCSYKTPKEDGVIEISDDQFGQLWKVLVASDDPNVKDDTYFRLMNRASGKCLRSAALNPANNAPLQLSNSMDQIYASLSDENMDTGAGCNRQKCVVTTDNFTPSLRL